VKLSVFGLGYVGCVAAACLADAGHDVVGVDVNPTKVEIINSGTSPIIEDGISELIAKVVRAGRLSATTDSARAIRDSDISLVCVGTPSNQNGSLHLRHVEQVCAEIGAALKNKNERHVRMMLARDFQRGKSVESGHAGIRKNQINVAFAQGDREFIGGRDERHRARNVICLQFRPDEFRIQQVVFQVKNLQAAFDRFGRIHMCLCPSRWRFFGETTEI